MKKSNKVTLELKEEEANILIEALLFATSINVGADWEEDNIDKMLVLCKKLKKQLNSPPRLDHIVFYKEENYEDRWSQSVFDFFKDSNNVIQLQEA